MLGAIIGDVVGSRFEWHNLKSKEFELFTEECRLTDDSYMTLAIAKAVHESNGDLSLLADNAVRYMQEIGRKHPDCGFGGRFYKWVHSDDPKPYRSFGNGAAMRVSACGFEAETLSQAIDMAETVTRVSHNHPEGMKGAVAIAVAVFMAKDGSSKREISNVMSEYYDMSFTLEEIRSDYKFDVSCPGSVPQAIEAFLEADGFEDAIRNAISIGGDSDTIAAMAGSIAEAYYGVPEDLREKILSILEDSLDMDEKEILWYHIAK